MALGTGQFLGREFLVDALQLQSDGHGTWRSPVRFVAVIAADGLHISFGHIGELHGIARHTVVSRC